MSDDKKNEKVDPSGGFKNISVLHADSPDTKHIVLPVLDGKPMTPEQGIYWLKKIQEEQNRTFVFNYKFSGWYPFDAMWALYRAMVSTYGFAHVRDFEHQGFFGKIKVPPEMISIDVAKDKKQQIPWGPIEVSGLSVPLVPSLDLDNGQVVLRLTAEIKNSEKHIVEEMMKRAEDNLRTSSIYRGKAVEVDFTMFNPRDFRFDVNKAPKFIDTDINANELVLPQDVYDMIDTSLWTPIRHAAICKEQKIPLRRSTLLAGKYGVGKTLTAKVTAKICEENGWTFLYLKDLNQLAQALYFAKKYQPAVIFAEDINRIVSGERDARMDNIFNIMDGIDRKTDDVMTVFTTNDLDEIHPAMLRPGRMDSIIVMTSPDAKAVERLIRLYGRNMVDPNEDLTQVGLLLAGQIPAIIGEAVEKSKLAAIKDTKPGEKLVVKERHLIIAAKLMLEHASLLEEPEAPKPDIEVFGETIANVLLDGARAYFDKDDEVASFKDVAKLVLDDAGRPSDKKSKPVDRV